ncbi:MAG: glutamine amidotransferase class-I [Proteobacteria bacterium]|nr:glutamine amidotransferase class-I [Pseudomonadota bacterium]
MKTALAITHVSFEDLGGLAGALQQAGFRIDYRDAATADLKAIDPETPDLLVVLGGPIGVYEQTLYPFLADELALLRQRLARKLPTLGICLGAQLMASALGAKVYPGSNGKEIGWSPVFPPATAEAGNPLQTLFAAGLKVLHWHGDTFDLPAEARLLASSARYPHQAFAVGDHALAFQFHPEVQALGLERWYVGHACELSQAGVDVPALREQSAIHTPRLQQPADQLWRAWLAKAFTPSDESVPSR